MNNLCVRTDGNTGSLWAVDGSKYCIRVTRRASGEGYLKFLVFFEFLKKVRDSSGGFFGVK